MTPEPRDITRHEILRNNVLSRFPDPDAFNNSYMQHGIITEAIEVCLKQAKLVICLDYV